MEWAQLHDRRVGVVPMEFHRNEGCSDVSCRSPVSGGRCQGAVDVEEHDTGVAVRSRPNAVSDDS